MNKIKTWFKRTVPFLLTFSVLFVVFAFPVSASANDTWLVDYNDYVERVTSVNGEDYCFVKTPISWTDWELNEIDDEAVYNEIWEDTNLIYWEHTGNNYGTISFSPLGDHRLDLTYIPYGTLVKLGIQMEYTTSFVDVKADVTVNYYDKNGNVIATRWDSSIDITYGSYVFCDVNLDYPTGAKSASFTFDIYKYSPGYMAEVYMMLKDFEMTLTIGSDTRIQEKLDKNNGLLEDVESEQEKTNEKLDEIIDSTVAPADPEGGDAVGDYNDFEEEIMNDMSSNFSEADGYITTAVEIIAKYGSALLAVSHLFGIFWRFPFFAELVLVAFAFGMFATLLGVAFGAISAHDRKAVRANRGKGKGG